MFEDGTKVATAAVAMTLACIAWGQEPSSVNRMITEGTPPAARMPATVTPDFRDVSFAAMAQVVAQLSGRTLIVGQGVCALITASWQTELTPAQFYQEFVSISHALGFIVVEQGSVTTITLDAQKAPATCGKYFNRQGSDN